jgi:predicted PurR-regulated permease PerM
MVYISLFIVIIIVFVIFINQPKTKDIIIHVAENITFYQNKNVKDINYIIQCLKEENKKIRPSAGFYLPRSMKITEENNEIIIYYKKLIFNVTKGIYIE